MTSAPFITIPKDERLAWQPICDRYPDSLQLRRSPGDQKIAVELIGGDGEFVYDEE
jgi:hypothetical protein